MRRGFALTPTSTSCSISSAHHGLDRGVTHVSVAHRRDETASRNRQPDRTAEPRHAARPAGQGRAEGRRRPGELAACRP